MTSFFNDKVKTPILNLLKSGVSPQSIALAMAFGVSGGVFPIPGLTTIPVMVAIFLFRLNPVAAMLTNYLCTPLNIASVPLFIYYGNAFFGSADGAADFSVSKFMTDLKEDTIGTLLLFRFTLLNAISMWFLFAPVATITLYIILTPILKSIMPKTKNQKNN